MKNLHKAVLFWVTTVFLVILSAFVLVSINQKLNTAATTNTVSFSGEGKVLAKPDVAVINLSIVTEGATSKEAQDLNSEKSKKAVDFLKKQKIDEKDVKTTGYNIYPRYSYPKDSEPVIKGYQVTESLEVKVRDLTGVGDILDGVVSAGANQVASFRFEVDEPEKLKAKARELAIGDAKKKAGELKSQLGIRLGRIINFSEGFSGYPVPIYLETGALAKGGGGPELPAGENEISMNVTITYQIK